jgi:CheY-like chemotaxis protein
MVKPDVRQDRERVGVLVVDDEHMVRIVVRLGLERHGFDVWIASNGREAIDIYRQHRNDIDVALVDVCMPGLDGPQVLDELRSLNPAVLVCFMSGNTGAYTPQHLIQRGAAHVFAKPFLLSDLANVLRLVVPGKSAELLPSSQV